MTGLAMGCPTPELQGGIKEPETNPSFSQQKEQTDATRGEVITECDQDVDYKPGGSEPEIKAVNEEEGRMCKNGATSRQDIVSENNEPQGCIIKQVHRNQGP